EMRDDRLGTLRQDQRDAVAARNTRRGERIGEPVRLLLHVEERERFTRAVLVLPIQRETRTIGRPTTAAGLCDVEIGRYFPAMRRVDLGVAVDGRHAASIRKTTSAAARSRSRSSRAAARSDARSAACSRPGTSAADSAWPLDTPRRGRSATAP